MGIGDEIMLAGEARRRAAGSAQKFRILDKRGDPRWHFVWEGNPNIARPGEPYDDTLGMSAGRRPYVERVEPNRYTFREYRPAPAVLRLGPQAKVFAQRAAGAVLFNPAIKDRASPNKRWPIERWAALIERTPGVRWIQLQEPGVRRLGRVETLVCANFMDAAGALSGARAVVCHEGALHHAAAAVGTPAVVIRGGFISPRVTGYDGQVDLYIESEEYPLGCGWRVPCPHCRAAMESITHGAVAAALTGILENKGKA